MGRGGRRGGGYDREREFGIFRLLHDVLPPILYTYLAASLPCVFLHWCVARLFVTYTIRTLSPEPCSFFTFAYIIIPTD